MKKLEDLTVDEKKVTVTALMFLGELLNKIGACQCGNPRCVGNLPLTRASIRGGFEKARAEAKRRHAKAVAHVAEMRETADKIKGAPLAEDMLAAIVKDAEREAVAAANVADDAKLDALWADVEDIANRLFGPA